MSEQFDWRKYLRVHPEADRLPMMEEDELQELAANIKKNGLRVGIGILGKKPDQDQPSKELPILIDGRNRLDALALAGMLAVNNQGRLCIKVSNDDEQGLRLIRQNYHEGDPDEIVLSLNVYRRHLSREAKRMLIAKALEADPTKSDRQIGREAKADGKTVAKIRADLEGRAEFRTSEPRTDTLGRQQPATKPSKPLKPPRRLTGHDLDETEEIAVGIELFRWLSWNGRQLMTQRINKLYDEWERGAIDEPSKLELSRLVVRLAKRLDQAGLGEVLDAIDQIFTNENVDGV